MAGRTPDYIRDLEILKLRAAGMSVGAISYQLQDGTTPQQITNIVKRHAEEARDACADLVNEQWYLGIYRAEQILQRIAREIDDGQAAKGEIATFLALALRVNERLAKQLGLDKDNKSETWLGGANSAEMERIAGEYGIPTPKMVFGKPA